MEFGRSITLWGKDTLVIGAPGESVSGKRYAGAVYLKVRGQAKMTRLVSQHDELSETEREMARDRLKKQLSWTDRKSRS